MMSKIFWFFPILFFSLVATARGIEPIAVQLKSGTESVVEQSALILSDPAGSYDFQEILTGEPSKNFMMSQELKTSGRMKSGAYWMHFILENKNDRNQDWVISLVEKNFRDVVLYSRTPAGYWVTTTTGAAVPVELRPRKTNELSFHVTIARGEKRDYFLRVESRLFRNLKVVVQSDLDSEESGMLIHFVTSAYFGILIALVFSSLFFYLIMRESPFLYYMLFATTFGAFLFIYEGYFDYFLFIPGGWGRWGPTFGNLSCVFAIYFAYSYLRLRTELPKIAKIVTALAGVFSVLVLLSQLEDQSIPAFVSDVSVVFGCVVMMYAAFRRYRQGDRQAFYFLCSWSSFLPFVVWHSLVNLGVLPTFKHVRMLLYFGSAFEMILMSFGLVHRLRMAAVEKAKSKAQLEAKEELAENMRSLVRVLSHDLASPLTIVKNTAEIRLRDQSMSETERRSWDRVLKACKIETAILTNVRDFQKLSDGKMSLELLPVKVNEFISNLQFVFSDSLKAKDLSLVVQANAEDLNVEVLADETSINSHVLNNLISNAIKFSPVGKTVKIQVRVHEDQVEIEVHDQGVGIPQEILQNLFNPRVKTSRRGTAGESGTGFGMPIAKAFMEAHGGSIVVTSSTDTEQSGTCAKITLRRHKSSTIAAAA